MATNPADKKGLGMNDIKNLELQEETGRTRRGPSPATPPARPGVLHPHMAGGARQREGVHRPTRQVAGGGPPEGEPGQVPAPARLKMTISR